MSLDIISWNMQRQTDNLLLFFCLWNYNRQRIMFNENEWRDGQTNTLCYFILLFQYFIIITKQQQLCTRYSFIHCLVHSFIYQKKINKSWFICVPLHLLGAHSFHATFLLHHTHHLFSSWIMTMMTIRILLKQCIGFDDG